MRNQKLCFLSNQERAVPGNRDGPLHFYSCLEDFWSAAFQSRMSRDELLAALESRAPWSLPQHHTVSGPGEFA